MVVHEWGEFIYAPPECRTGPMIRTPEDEKHHLHRVRRINPGSTVFATDGEGCVYCCVVESDFTLRIEEELPMFGEPRVPVVLCMAVLKGDGNRDIMDAATQMGVSRVLFFHAARSEGRLAEEKADKLRRVAIAAIKQCGRAICPHIEIGRDMGAILDSVPASYGRYIANPASRNQKSRGDIPTSAAGLALLVGPEGGLTDVECGLATDRGWIPLHLGNRRFRSETAVNAGLAFLLVQAGECRAY